MNSGYFKRLCEVLAIILLVAACAKPQTILPHIDKAEIEAERKHQEEFLYQKDFSYIYAKEPTKRMLEKRLVRVSKRIGVAAIKLCNELRLIDESGDKRRCVFDVDMGSAKDKSINAFTDGNRIQVSRKMIQLFPRDDQLAAIIAHEFAHAIMQHVDDTDHNITTGAILGEVLDSAMSGMGVRTGSDFGRLGQEVGWLAYSPTYENEADYVGLYIMKRAGYRLDRAPEVWRTLAAISHKDMLYVTTTHPTSPERFVRMKSAITEINRKARQKQALLPKMKRDTTPGS